MAPAAVLREYADNSGSSIINEVSFQRNLSEIKIFLYLYELKYICIYMNLFYILTYNSIY